MNARLTIPERNHADRHNRVRDLMAADAIGARNEQKERNAVAWGLLAKRSIANGHYQTAINQLRAAIGETSNPQYTGPSFAD